LSPPAVVTGEEKAYSAFKTDARGKTMRVLSLCASAFLVLGLVSLPPALADDGRCNDKFEFVMGGGFSGVRDAKNLVITNRMEWCAFWDEVHSNMLPSLPCDLMGIDFSEEAAIAVALGARPNTCYGVNINCIHRAEGSDNLVVFYQEFIPENGCLCAFVVTHPYAVVKVSKPVDKVNFNGRDGTYSCD
jgi:hypothetical protein